MGRVRKNHTAQEKASILREHLIEKVPVSELCERHGIQPTVFYRWQKRMFENLPGLFERSRGSDGGSLKAQNEALKAKLAHKDMVIAEIMEDFIETKKTLGGD
jgi:transposase-like protein